MSREMKEKQTELYRYFDEKGSLLYVGISLNAVSRAAQHRMASFWYKDATTITIERFDDRKSALQAEKKAIKKEKPVYNVIHNNNLCENKENKENETKAEYDRRKLLKRTVFYKPIYTQDEVGKIIFGDNTNSRTKVKQLIEDQKLQGILVHEYTQKSRSGGERIVRKYVVTGWQLIDFVEALEEGQTSL